MRKNTYVEEVVNFTDTPQLFGSFNKKYYKSASDAPDISVDVQLINLDRRPDRIEYMNEHMPKSLVYNHFSAIDGSVLGKYYREREETRSLLDIIRGRDRVPGEIGCCLSHYLVWKNAAESARESMARTRTKTCLTLVLEDDIRFTNETLPRFNKTLADISQYTLQSLMNPYPNPSTPTKNDPLAWDVMYVGGQWTPDYGLNSNAYFDFQRIKVGENGSYFHPVIPNQMLGHRLLTHVGGTLYRRRNMHYSAIIHGSMNVWSTCLFRTAGAYLVSPEGAKKLIRAVNIDRGLFMRTPLDMWLLEMDFRGYINVFDSITHPFYQGGFELVTDHRLVANDIHRGNYRKIELD